MQKREGLIVFNGIVLHLMQMPVAQKLFFANDSLPIITF